jgi:Ulp1 family protease
MTTKSSQLQNDPELILKNAIHMKTPQQNNSINCGLFGVITLLHLIHGVPIDDMTFSQQDITKLRQGLSTNGMKYLSRNVALYFFPLLKKKIPNEAADTR